MEKQNKNDENYRSPLSEIISDYFDLKRKQGNELSVETALRVERAYEELQGRGCDLSHELREARYDVMKGALDLIEADIGCSGLREAIKYKSPDFGFFDTGNNLEYAVQLLNEYYTKLTEDPSMLAIQERLWKEEMRRSS